MSYTMPPYPELRAADEAESPPKPPWQVELDSGVVIDLLSVAPGQYNRGSKRLFAGERPLHRVTITRLFWIGRFPVTQEQYRRVEGNNPAHFPGDRRPVEMVNWYEAAIFCRHLTEREARVGRLPENHVFRLPTEAEWEYAARGGQRSLGFKYAGGNRVEDVAWHGGGMGGNSAYETSPVGLKLPNELGLYDMSGNVWEWCHDWHEDYPKVSSLVDPTGPLEGSHRTLRGGSWGYEPACCRLTRRDGLTPAHRYCDLGFRIVLAPPLKLLKRRTGREAHLI